MCLSVESSCHLGFAIKPHLRSKNKSAMKLIFSCKQVLFGTTTLLNRTENGAGDQSFWSFVVKHHYLLNFRVLPVTLTLIRHIAKLLAVFKIT